MLQSPLFGGALYACMLCGKKYDPYNVTYTVDIRCL